MMSIVQHRWLADLQTGDAAILLNDRSLLTCLNKQSSGDLGEVIEQIWSWPFLVNYVIQNPFLETSQWEIGILGDIIDLSFSSGSVNDRSHAFFTNKCQVETCHVALVTLHGYAEYVMLIEKKLVRDIQP